MYGDSDKAVILQRKIRLLVITENVAIPHKTREN